MGLKLSKFECFLAFCAFLLIAGAMVSVGYLLLVLRPVEATATATTPSNPAPAKVADAKKPVIPAIEPTLAVEKPVEKPVDLLVATAKPATQPAPITKVVVALPAVRQVPAEALPPVVPPRIEAPKVETPVVFSPRITAATQIIPPSKRTVVLAPIEPPQTAPVTPPSVQAVKVETPVAPAIAVAPVAVTPIAVAPVAIAQKPEVVIKPVLPKAEIQAPVDPYEVKIGLARVVRMFADEAGTACWYELKLDRPQLDLLRTTLMKIGAGKRYDVAEFDHLAEAWPAPATPLAWWRPRELIDVNLISISSAGSEGKRIWAAVSLRTGRVFLYSDQPLAFTGADR